MTELVVILVMIAPSLIAVVYTIALGIRSAARARRRRRRRLRGLSDLEVSGSLGYDPAQFGIDISMWPSRAPRNGAAYEDAE